MTLPDAIDVSLERIESLSFRTGEKKKKERCIFREN